VSGIHRPQWWRGRGGLYDSRGRIVPRRIDLGLDPALFPGQEGGPDLPGGVALWGLWNSYNQLQAGGNGDTFTASGLYSGMADQSGNGRDLADRSGSAFTDASAAIYPGHLGDVVVPLTTGTKRLFYNTGADFILESFMLVTLSPWGLVTRSNTTREWAIIWGGSSGQLVGMAWFSGSGGQLQLDWDGSAGGVGTGFAMPQVTGLTAADWLCTGVMCTSGGAGGTDVFRVVAISDIGGAGPTLVQDQAFSTTATQAGTTRSRRESCRGIINQGDGEKPLCSFYTGADTDIFEAVILSAIANRDPSAVAAAAALL
jgi:hypothetical protein